jgi:ABC-type cobalt transport system substrate-binding protein
MLLGYCRGGADPSGADVCTTIDGEFFDRTHSPLDNPLRTPPSGRPKQLLVVVKSMQALILPIFAAALPAF